MRNAVENLCHFGQVKIWKEEWLRIVKERGYTLIGHEL
jgi:hypothetical protein